jgi:AraC-like DNA-binding protein
MSTIEAGLRGSGIAVLLLLALFAWRDAWRLPTGRYSTLFMLSAACYLIEAAPGAATSDALWILPFRELSVMGPAVFQLWARATFEDSFRPSWVAWLPTAGLAGLGIWAMSAHAALPWHVVHAVALVLIGIGIWHVLAGRSGDLVEGRRRLRPILATAAGLAGVGFTLLAALASPQVRAHASLVTVGIVLALAMVSAITRLGLHPLAELAAAADRTSPRLGPMAGAAIAIDPEERVLLDRLQRLMEEHRIYREEGLGIASLAARLGLPEYRLRRLINQRLGHRNFSSFVNGYRLAEAIAALSDPAQAQVPILTIALDAGFQSIGPFNRAFKAQTGLTPTDFRREQVERASRAAE